MGNDSGIGMYGSSVGIDCLSGCWNVRCEVMLGGGLYMYFEIEYIF